MIEKVTIKNVAAELERYQRAKQEAAKQLKKLYEKAVIEVGEANAQIFEVHAMMLEDNDYNDSVCSMISFQRVNAEYAVTETKDNFIRMFVNMEDDYFRARAADIKDISERLVAVLREKKTGRELREASIIVTDDLSPSETVEIDKSKLLAFATLHGTSNSHTAILAKTMNIPTIIGVAIDESWHGKMGIVDGYQGLLIIEPDEETLDLYYEKKRKKDEERSNLQKLRDAETVTKSGRKVNLYANIGNGSDLPDVLQNDAEGIGLFRSEFLYLGRRDYPTENEQFVAYRQVAETMAGKKVIIRTFDIGADKQADYFKLDHEVNPAMGYRAIRICLTQTELFKTQLRAIYRAAAYGNIAVMYPMIISVDEVRQIKKIVAEVMKELDEEGIPYGRVEQGIMIETPAAAILSAELAKEVDFFSIGTNDLTQYTLAVDRQNTKLEDFYNPHHPAVLCLIEYVVASAHQAGIWAGICGELAADTSLTEAFVQMGVDELSVPASLVLAVRKAVRDCE